MIFFSLLFLFFCLYVLMISQGLGVDEESSRLEVLQALPFFSLKRQLKKVSEERGQRE